MGEEGALVAINRQPVTWLNTTSLAVRLPTSQAPFECRVESVECEGGNEGSRSHTLTSLESFEIWRGHFNAECRVQSEECRMRGCACRYVFRPLISWSDKT